MENKTEPEPEPKVIGLTGGIGSGKSTVAKFLIEMGYPVYNSDTRAKELVNESDDLKSKIISLLGEKAYDAEGNYDRKFVADLVFNDKDLLEKLNSLIHPAVALDFAHWVHSQSAPLLFKEAALLFELKLRDKLDSYVLVTADDNTRMKRVMDRDGKTYREIENIMDKQMPEREKCRKADFIIYNNGNLDELEVETKAVVEAIKDKLLV